MLLLVLLASGVEESLVFADGAALASAELPFEAGCIVSASADSTTPLGRRANRTCRNRDPRRNRRVQSGLSLRYSLSGGRGSSG